MFVALVTQYAKCMRHVIFASVTSPTLQHFSTLSHTPHDFRKKTLLSMKCVFWFSLQLCPKRFSFWEELSEIWS